jgi:hypothetical protein
MISWKIAASHAAGIAKHPMKYGLFAIFKFAHDEQQQQYYLHTRDDFSSNTHATLTSSQV